MKIFMAVFLALSLFACSEEEEVFDTQIEAVDRAKALEEEMKEAAEKQREAIEQQTDDP